jgi:hypothetical protein
VATAPATKPVGTDTAAEPAVDSTVQPEAGMQVPEGWQGLTDDIQGYSLIYPMEWRYSEDTIYSRVFSEKSNVPDLERPPLRLYISAYPKEHANQDWDVYNFIPGDIIQRFMDLPVGQSMLKVPGGPMPEYITYTRLPDRTVAGQAALVIENSKVWEFPPGTKERVVFLVTEGNTYMVGMYYETPEQLAKFEQVLDSFKVAE